MRLSRRLIWRPLAFEGVIPEKTGRPSYHPATILKIYIYGYLNQVQSSRGLERVCHRNLEMIWLTGRLAPDFKTIADFRRDDGPAIRKLCQQFVVRGGMNSSTPASWRSMAASSKPLTRKRRALRGRSCSGVKLMLHLRRAAADPRVEILLSLMTPYLAYWEPERLGGSGVLATVAAGLYVSWNGHGPPEHIRSDNGPEFIAINVREWLGRIGVMTLYIEPGSPWENGYCESLNSKLREELERRDLHDAAGS